MHTHSAPHPTRNPNGSCPAASVVTIGNFDGLHLGHQELIKATRKLACELRCRSIVVSFSPHPSQYFCPNQPNRLLFSESQKRRALYEWGIDEHIKLKFDEHLARLSHKDFLQKLLIDKLQAKGIVVGGDFRFGKDRLGNVDYLHAEAANFGFVVVAKQKIAVDGIQVSSTRIRREIAETGNVTLANRLMGHPYLIEGASVKGNQLGRQLGFPTVNIETDQVLPRNGVYVGRMALAVESPIRHIAEETLPVVINVGTRPTIENSSHRSLEAHTISNWNHGEIYGSKVGLYFTRRLRDEQKFANLDELKTQIALDIELARPFFRDQM